MQALISWLRQHGNAGALGAKLTGGGRGAASLLLR